MKNQKQGIVIIIIIVVVVVICYWKICQKTLSLLLCNALNYIHNIPNDDDDEDEDSSNRIRRF